MDLRWCDNETIQMQHESMKVENVQQSIGTHRAIDQNEHYHRVVNIGSMVHSIDGINNGSIIECLLPVSSLNKRQLCELQQR